MSELKINIEELIKTKDALGEGENASVPERIKLERFSIDLYRQLGPNNVKIVIEELTKLLAG